MRDDRSDNHAIYLDPYADQKAAQQINLNVDASKHYWMLMLIGIVSALALAMAFVACATAYTALTELRLANLYLTDSNYRTPEELDSWRRFRQENK